MNKLGVRACAYCNAETVFSLLVHSHNPDSFGIGAEKRSPLDHYRSHSEYPFLGISLYNLVPSCVRCNTNIKGTKIISRAEYLHPYEDDFDALISFRVAYNDLSGFYRIGDLDFEVYLEPKKFGAQSNDVRRARATVGFFYLRDVYNQLYRSNIADVMRRIRFYPVSYLKFLNKTYPGITKIFKERMVWGGPLSSEEINHYPLSKMTKRVIPL